METPKHIASLSLDLDNQWSYMKTHGDPGWEPFPSYLDVVVPRVLSFLKERNLKITFFIVGQDAILEKNHAALSSIASAGHEIGNHSFNHDPWLHLYSEQQINREIALAEEHIEWVTGQNPIGFRGPGYSLSRAVLKVLTCRGYQYDASTLPTFIGPLARAYYFMTAKLSSEEKRQRAKLFGTLKDGFRPIRPYRWNLDDNGKQEGMIEIPVTTLPILKIPFHLSYILYLSLFSQTLAIMYFKTALLLCRFTNTRPSLLLHPLDFLDSRDVPELSFFPAMKLTSEKKLLLVSEVLRLFSNHFTVLPLQQHVHDVRETSGFLVIEPSFQPA
ncbi:MAG: polysaccharide deacetylase [Chloroflexi bacterium RBG_16_48_8]|nr:MAG: polysaccharide deacetylase [Chloroflexi bacterium RBG_16_48_8]